MYETDEDYEAARQAAEARADEYGDFKYETWKDRDLEME
jgi:hypothetical protein